MGRERELANLSERFRAPRPSEVEVLLIAGEPGVGKTRLIQEAALVARGLGWVTLLGHAYETDGMPPYLPFIEALQEHLHDLPPDVYKSRLAEGSPALALLMPDVPSTAAATRTDPEVQRYWLFEAVCEFLATTVEPSQSGLLLCLEDLHWSDESTLMLLEHLTRKKVSAPILVLGTYRDTDLDVSRPLARTIEQLMRQRVASRVDLRRLDREELSELLVTLGGPDPPLALVEALYAETEGNPFFVREVFEYLATDGRLFDDDGRWRRGLRLQETDVPQGLRLVIGRRLERLSQECRRVLAVAAVLGRRFGFGLLQSLAQVSEQALLDAVEEAERAQVLLADASGGFSFCHELVRQTLLAGLSPMRRQRQHLLAAEALEAVYARDLRPHLAEIAGQYRLAGAAADPEKVIDFSLQAARAAEEIYAWQEAAKLYEVALEVAEASNHGDDAERCDLLLALMAALLPAGEGEKVLDEVAPQAYSLAESLNDRRRMGAVTLAAVDTVARLWGPSGAERGSIWLDRADECVAAETKERVMVDARKALRLQEQGLAAQRATLALHSYEMAKRVGDREAVFLAASQALLNTPPPAQFIPQMTTVLREVMVEPREGLSFRTLGLFLSRAGLASLVCGERSSFEDMLVELENLAGRVNDTFVQGDVVMGQVTRHTLDGRLHEALELFRTNPPASPLTRMQILVTAGRLNLWLGRFREVVADFEAVPAFWSSPAPPTMFEAAAIAYLAAAGMADGTRTRLSAWAVRGHALNEMNLNWQLWTLEAAVLLRDLDLARRLSSELQPVAHLSTGSHVAPKSPGLLLGEAAALFGQPHEARSFYEIALQAAEKISFRPEIALAHLSLGELLLKDYPAERPIALEHLDFAIAEFEEMDMRPSLQRALRLRGRRRRAPEKSPTYPDGLSEREVEVLRLIAAGKSNREIAEMLFLGVRTVERHIANIYSKTRVHSKAQATAYADRHVLP